jgi:hypothetical protein
MDPGCPGIPLVPMRIIAADPYGPVNTTTGSEGYLQSLYVPIALILEKSSGQGGGRIR